MKNTYFSLSIVLCCIFIAGCPRDGKKSMTPIPNEVSETPDPFDLTDPNREIHLSFASSITGIDYPLHIYLPPNYENSSQDYPVIYATDGQWIFYGFGNIIDQKRKEVILVAIEQGPNNRRAIDYRLPGAPSYFNFLAAELLPYIESNYRIDATNRTLLGTSYGGILSGLAPLIDDVEMPLFKNYLSFDPSFYENQRATMELEQTRYNASGELHATIMFTSATLRGNDPYVTWYKNLLEQREYDRLEIIRYAYAVDHNDVANPSFSTALDLLF